MNNSSEIQNREKHEKQRVSIQSSHFGSESSPGLRSATGVERDDLQDISVLSSETSVGYIARGQVANRLSLAAEVNFNNFENEFAFDSFMFQPKIRSQIDDPNVGLVIELGKRCLKEGRSNRLRAANSNLINEGALLLEWCLYHGAELREEEHRRLARAHFQLWNTAGVDADSFNLARCIANYDECMEFLVEENNLHDILTHSKSLYYSGRSSDAVGEAQYVFQRSSPQDPMRPFYQLFIAALLKEQGELGRAIDHFGKALALGPPTLLEKKDMLLLMAFAHEEIFRAKAAADEREKLRQIAASNSSHMQDAEAETDPAALVATASSEEGDGPGKEAAAVEEGGALSAGTSHGNAEAVGELSASSVPLAAVVSEEANGPPSNRDQYPQNENTLSASGSNCSRSSSLEDDAVRAGYEQVNYCTIQATQSVCICCRI